VDPTINEARMEMYADTESRGGILEPPGICEVKFRDKDQKAAMHRLDPMLQELDGDPSANEADIKARENLLAPMYMQVAHEFADLHDRSGRMLAKGVIRAKVEWPDARKYFHGRLTRRLAVDRLAAGAGVEAAEVEARLSKACEGKGVDWEDDVAVSAFIAKEGAAIEAEMKAATRASAVSATVAAFEDLDDEAKAAVMDKLK